MPDIYNGFTTKQSQLQRITSSPNKKARAKQPVQKPNLGEGSRVTRLIHFSENQKARVSDVVPIFQRVVEPIGPKNTSSQELKPTNAKRIIRDSACSAALKSPWGPASGRGNRFVSQSLPFLNGE
jgi:hypothetical protein